MKVMITCYLTSDWGHHRLKNPLHFQRAMAQASQDRKKRKKWKGKFHHTYKVYYTNQTKSNLQPHVSLTQYLDSSDSTKCVIKILEDSCHERIVVQVKVRFSVVQTDQLKCQPVNVIWHVGFMCRHPLYTTCEAVQMDLSFFLFMLKHNICFFGNCTHLQHFYTVL